MLEIDSSIIIYIFHSPPMPEEQQGWMSFFSKAVTASANYLPTQVTDVFNQGRAVASIHLPFQGLKNICTIVM